jgi:hypothetical protein
MHSPAPPLLSGRGRERDRQVRVARARRTSATCAHWQYVDSSVTGAAAATCRARAPSRRRACHARARRADSAPCAAHSAQAPAQLPAAARAGAETSRRWHDTRSSARGRRRCHARARRRRERKVRDLLWARRSCQAGLRRHVAAGPSVLVCFPRSHAPAATLTPLWDDAHAVGALRRPHVRLS